MKLKQLPYICLGFLLALTITACGIQGIAQETPTPEVKILKIGVLGPFTGPSASTGTQMKNATTMAFEEIDYRIGDYDVELVWIDSQSDPETASSAYEKAIKEGKIQAGILNWHSSVAIAVMEVTARNKTPHFFGSGSSTIVDQKFHTSPEFYGYWNFKGWPGTPQITSLYVSVLEDAIADNFWDIKEKRVALFGEDTDWGRGFGNAIKPHLEENGWDIVYEEYSALDESDFSAVVKELEEQEVTLIAGTATGDVFFSEFLKEVEKSELDAIVIADGLGWVGNWYELTGSASNYVLDQIPGWPTDKALAFAEEYETRWEETPSPSSSGLAYDYTRFFIKIAQATYDKYGEINNETLYKFGQEEVQTGQLTYTDGILMPEYKYTENTVPNPVVGMEYYTFPVRQYMDGESLIIWPNEWKEADFQTKP